MRILVTGGAGFVGSHAVRSFVHAGHQVVVLDNLSHGHREAVEKHIPLIRGSTADFDLLVRCFRDFRIEAVAHFAADIEVAESVADPLKYYGNNFANSLVLLRAMRECEVHKLVFSSSAAVYGEPLRTPIDEMQPRQPINPYGRSKMMTEMAIEDFSATFGLSYTILRYFNVAGCSPDGAIGEDHRPETHLIPQILNAAREGNGEVTIFGGDYPTPDGTCIRDYVHVVDVVRAHTLALETMRPGQGRIFNLGSERGFSVREIVAACQRVTGRRLRVTEEARRPGDPAILVANSQKIRRALGWAPIYPDIDLIVRHAWAWIQQRPDGYGELPHFEDATDAPANVISL